MSIALSTHKVAAVAVGVAMVFSFAFVTPANAQTVEDLTAQINSLLATIAGLQAQLAGLTGGSTPAPSGACYNFTLNHSDGDQGGEVMNIQKFLNMSGSQVSATGAGSPGNETDYFGSRTKAAVMAWQNANAASVLTPVGLSAGTGYWGPSSRAHANAMETARCAGGVTPGPGPVVPGTGLTVSAAAQPGNGLAVAGAARVPFTKFTLTNSSAGPVTVDSVTVERGGVASNTPFDGVVLLDQNGTQLGNARVINSNNQATIGEAVVLNPGESRTFTVAANMEATLTNQAGEVATFSVVAINTSATVSGSLPITGAAHTINATLSIGSVTAARGVEDPNSAETKEIGTTNYTFTAVKLTAGSAEDVRLHSIRFDQSGSASSADVNNVKVTVDGVEYTPTIMGDYYVVTFGGGLVIKEGLTKEIVVTGDIIGGTNRNVAFDIHKFTDINVTGETYGYGLTPTAGTGFSSTSPVFDASVVTISQGTFNSVSKSNAAPAANIAEQKADELLGAFTVDIKGEPITVQTLRVRADDGTSTWTADVSDITNVTLVDQNGSILAGPVDGDGTDLTSPTALGSFTFSNVEFPTGVTTLFVKGQLGTAFANNDKVVLSTTPDATSDDWADATGDITGDSVTLPTATATANIMTVKAAALSATTLTQPTARSVVGGATDFIWATASLDASDSGEDIRVSTIILEDTVATAGNASDIDNVEIWANLSGGTANDSVRGDKYETRVSDAEQWTGTGTGDNDLSIGLETKIDVPKNSSVEIAVVGDLASGPTTGGTHSVSIRTDGSDVTAVGKTSGQSVTVNATGSGQAMTPAANGALTITVDSSSPDGTLILDDTSNEQTLGVFRFAATNVEDVEIDSITLTDDGTQFAGGAADDTVASYRFYVGSTLVGTKVGGATAQVFFADGTVVAPADGHVLVTVKAIMNNIDGTGVSNGDSVQATIAAAGDVEATGRDSGASITPTLTTGDPDAHEIFEAVPSVAFDNNGVSTVLVNNTNHLLAKIVLSNTGSEDITLNAADGNEIRIQISVIGDGTATPLLTLKDQDGNVLDSDNTYDTDAGAQEIVFDLDGAFTAGITVPAGGSETLSIFGDTSDLPDDGDTIQVWLDDAAADFAFGIDSAGDFTEGDNVFKGDIFGPVHVNPS